MGNQDSGGRRLGRASGDLLGGGLEIHQTSHKRLAWYDSSPQPSFNGKPIDGIQAVCVVSPKCPVYAGTLQPVYEADLPSPGRVSLPEDESPRLDTGTGLKSEIHAFTALAAANFQHSLSTASPPDARIRPSSWGVVVATDSINSLNMKAGVVSRGNRVASAPTWPEIRMPLETSRGSGVHGPHILLKGPECPQ